MIRAVLFDLYDTLVYVDHRAYQTKLAASARLVGVSSEEFRRAWYTTAPDSNLGRFASIEVRVQTVLGALGLVGSQRVVSRISNAERSFLTTHIHVFPDAFEALHVLRASGAKVAIVTNASRSVDHVLAGSGLRPLVEVVVVSSEIMEVKPNPAIYMRALERLNVMAIEACFVGDGNDREIDGARALGMMTILVRRDRPRYGLRESSNEAAADAVVSSLAEVPEVVRRLASQPRQR